jgi:hypothetical protein
MPFGEKNSYREEVHEVHEKQRQESGIWEIAGGREKQFLLP